MAHVKSQRWMGPALLLFGAVGLVASGAGWLPGAPASIWGCVLALGLAHPVALRWASARRVNRRELRLNRIARANARKRGRQALRKADGLKRKVDAVLAESARYTELREWAEKLSENVNRMVPDLLALKQLAGPLLERARIAEQREGLRGIQEEENT